MRPPCRSTIFLHVARPVPVYFFSICRETLVRLKYPLEIKGVNADAIVRDGKEPAFSGCRMHLLNRRFHADIIECQT